GAAPIRRLPEGRQGLPRVRRDLALHAGDRRDAARPHPLPPEGALRDGGGPEAPRGVSTPLLRDDRGVPAPEPAAAGAAAGAGRDTLARMFWHRVQASGVQPAQLTRHRERWRARTWAEVGEVVRELALGLLVLGLRPGDRVGLLSRSRAEWVQADFAILSAGAVPVPLYPTCATAQLAHIAAEVEARGLVVEDATQLVKVLETRHGLPALQWIVVIDGYDGRDPA